MNRYLAYGRNDSSKLLKKTLSGLGVHLTRCPNPSHLFCQSGRHGEPGRKLADPTASGCRAAAFSLVPPWALACCC
jgi:hypothetical protein